MMLKQCALTPLMLLAVFLFQGTPVLGGTTGSLSGTVRDSRSNDPVANARVEVTSATQTATTQTDASGHYVFVSLPPDTYTVLVTKTDYEPRTARGITVVADQTLTFDSRLQPVLKTIANVFAQAAGDLVKPGTTSDVYAVAPAVQKKVAPLNGGNNLDTAYSAIASVPGVYMPPYQSGWWQMVFIRGSDSGQEGYEYDGVPINRAFDNAPGGGLSSLGMQDVEVYTGGSPATANAPTLSGYINQVIKTGTYPPFASVESGVGYPAFLHRLKIEAGGSNKDRTFSYYTGVLGYDQGFHPVNVNDGANLALKYPGLAYNNAVSYSNTHGGTFLQGIFPACISRNAPYGEVDIVDPYKLSGTPPPGGDPGCLAFAPGYFAFAGPASAGDREAVLNLHFAIPHKRNAGHDDLQLLYSNSSIAFTSLTSYDDFGANNGFGAQLAGVCPLNGPNAGCAQTPANPYGGGLAACSGASYVCYSDTYTFPAGTTFGEAASGVSAIPYFFPLGGPRSPRGALPYDLRDRIFNNASIVKAQYQKNIGTNAYVRLYGYTDYSDFLRRTPNNDNNISCWYSYPSAACDFPDYELNSHSRGGALQFAAQLGPKHLVTGSAVYTTATTLRYNQFTTAQRDINTAATNLVGSDGNCYAWMSGEVGGQTFDRGDHAPCYSDLTAGTYGSPTQTGPLACGAGGSDAATAGCAADASWIVTVPGEVGPLNKVTPVFTTYSLQDEFRPNDKWVLNLGLRQENYVYKMVPADTPDYNFWFNAARDELCYDPATGLAVSPRRPPGSSGIPEPFIGFDCSQSEQSTALHPSTPGHFFTNHIAPTVESHILSPRFGFTYKLNANTVLRGTAGLYTQPPDSAFTEYLDASARDAALFDFTNFWGAGFASPRHDVPTERSINYDMSLEHRLNGTQISYKITPFYRLTLNQYEAIQLGELASGTFAAGTQKSYGAEFQINAGDVNRNGFAGQLSYTYTHAAIRYQNTGLGTNAIDEVNGLIGQYNALTQGGGGAPCYNNALISTANPNGIAPASDCSVNNGGILMTPAGLSAGDVINPYYLTSPQPSVDRNGWYPATELAAFAFVQAFYSGYSSPNVFSGFLNYKRNKLSVTPSFVLQQGSQYGSPLEIVGEDPRTCTGNQSNIPTAPNPGMPNYLTCLQAPLNGGTLAIPNPLTGRFDEIGQYQQPWQLLTNVMVTYDVSPRIELKFTAANVYNTCFGGSSTPWTKMFKPNSVYCAYGTNPWYVSNFYNGASPNDVTANGSAPFPFQRMPYGPLTIGQQPAQFTLTAAFKL